ncbi:MAG: prepilin peptidase [Anaerolineae bacterium]
MIGRLLVPDVWFYGLVGLGVGVLLRCAGHWLLQRRAKQENSLPLALAPAPRPPCSPAPPPRWMALVTGTGFSALWLRYGPSTQTVVVSAYFGILLLIFVLDIEHRWVPNVLLLPTALLALAVSVFTRDPPLLSALLGGIAGFVWFYLMAMACRSALGAGDVKLAGVIGLMTGFPGVLTALTLGILIGGGGAALLLISGQKTCKSYIPYAPFLVTGAFLTLVFGTQIVSEFSSLSGR